MPAAFDKAVKAGGRVRTIKGPNKHFGLGKGEYMHVVFHNGKMERGEVKREHAAVREMRRQRRHGGD